MININIKYFIITISALLLTIISPFIQVGVAFADGSLTLTGTQPQTAIENEAYSWPLSASGGVEPYSYNIIGTLPPGLSFDPESRTISGAPSSGLKTDKYSFNIVVSDSSDPALTIDFPATISIQYRSDISVTSALSTGGANIYADGQQVASIAGGKRSSLLFPSGTRHTISVNNPTLVSQDASVRFIPVTDKYVIDSRSPNATFDFSPEYEVRLAGNHAEIPAFTGSGWYKNGEIINSAAPAQIDGISGVQYRFAYWQLPSGEIYGNPNLNWKINKGGTITAVYDTYYYLTVNSQYCNAEGSGWQKEGTKARWAIVCAQSIPAEGFIGNFGAEMKPVNSSGTELMDSPKEVDVTWQADYSRLIIPVMTGVIVALILAILKIVHSRATNVVTKYKR